MAEILGTVASVLQMAALATKTILIGCSARALYREMQGASADIAASLDDVHIMTQILEEMRKSPMTTDIVLRTVLSRCEKCVQELQTALRTLYNKIQTSRGFFSSKWICLNFVVHKDTITKMQHRLETSLGHLLFAIQLASHKRLEQLIESQSRPSRTFYVSIATQSGISLGGSNLSTPSQLNQRYLSPGDTGEDEFTPTWPSMLLGVSPRNGGEVTHGFARRSTRSRHHLVRRTLQAN